MMKPPQSASSPARTAAPEIRVFLLADLRGYTRYTVEHGDEAAAALAARFESLARPIVDSHGGSVFGTAGDQVLAVFSSARQALAAARALQLALSGQNEASTGHGIDAGIGLDAGEAIPVGDDFRGSAVNLAARLCSLAGPGEVLASEAVIHLAGKLKEVSYTERGMVELKGFAGPQRVMAVHPSPPAPLPQGERGASSLERAAPERALPIGGFLGALPAGPIVARREELRRVLAAVEAVASGSGRLVMLVGEPGVGKTRLAQEVTLNVRNRDFLVAAGRCYEPRSAVAFYPFLEALDALYTACPVSIRTQVPDRWPYLARLLPEQRLPVPASSFEGQEEQERLFRSVAGFVCAIAARQPVAILLDDLHWADSATLELLQHLARSTRAERALLLGTYRDVEVQRQHPLGKAMRDLQREGLVERLAVRRLDEEDTAALIAATMGEAEFSAAFVELVHRSTEGNPFFAQELLRTLVERGDVYQQDGHWERREIEQIVVPESVRDAIGERLSRLSEETQEVLREASVLGQTFGFEELEGMSEVSERELEEALEEATAAGMLREAGKDIYRFDHALTQGALYEELPARRRRRLHLAAGTALEALPERKREGRAGELAWHFLQGDDAERALRYTLQAGDDAERVFAHAEAERHYRTALELTQELGDERQEAQAVENLGATLRALGRYDEALELLDQAAVMRRAAGSDEDERRIVAQIGQLHALRATPEAGIERVQSLLGRTDEERPSSGLAALYTALAQLLFVSSRDEELLVAATRAAEVAAAVGDDRTRAVAEGRRAVALLSLLRYEEALPALQAAAELAAAVGDLEALQRAINNMGVLHWTHGDLAASREYYGRGLEVALRLGHPAATAFARSNFAQALFYVGDWEEARRISEDAVEMVQPLGPVWSAAGPLLARGRIRVFQDSSEQAVLDLEDAIAIAQRSKAREFLEWAHAALAERDPLAGRAEAVISRIEPLLRGHSGHPTGRLLILQAEAHLLLGRPAAADELADEAIRRAGGSFARLVYMDALRVQAMARAIENRWDEAERMFSEALEMTRNMPYPYAEAKILFEWGRWEVERGMPDRGRQRLEEALAIFRRLGAKPSVARTEQALAALAPG